LLSLLKVDNYNISFFAFLIVYNCSWPLFCENLIGPICYYCKYFVPEFSSFHVNIFIQWND
jgi:hypothetical protein